LLVGVFQSPRATDQGGGKRRTIICAECRKLASMVHNLEDKYALDHAAQSWERLAARQERDIEAED